MALKTCRECGEQVSTEAGRCPHCGARHPTGRGLLDTSLAGNTESLITLVALAMAIAWLVWLLR